MFQVATKESDRAHVVLIMLLFLPGCSPDPLGPDFIPKDSEAPATDSLQPSQDIAQRDAVSSADLGASPVGDLGGPTRLIFLLDPARSGKLGNALDRKCDIAGAGTGRSFKMLVGQISRVPSGLFIPRHWRIVLPDGTHVSTDETFYSEAHANPIDEIISGAKVPKGSCVWTGFQANGTRTYRDCSSWSQNIGNTTGTAGTTDKANQGKWADDGERACSNLCYVYCIEQ